MALEDLIRERLDPRPLVPADMLGCNVECLINGPGQEKLNEWMTMVAKVEFERIKAEGGPATCFVPDTEDGVVLEYFGGYVDSVEHVVGSQISLSMKFRDERRWFVNPRSGGWICVDFEVVF